MMLGGEAHVLGDVDDVVQQFGECHFHGGACVVPHDERVDLVVLGPPCQPYSAMRANRAQVQPHQHKDFHTIFDDTINYIRVHRPRGGILENVTGFAKHLKPGFDDDLRPLPKSWLLKLLAELETFGYVHRVLKLDSGVWTEAPRERLSCVKTQPTQRGVLGNRTA